MTMEVRLNCFEYLCISYGITGKPNTAKNPWANGILEHVHQVLGQMLGTAELDMANSVTPNDVDVFLDNVAWAIRSTYYTVLKASPGAAFFGWDMLFDIPFVADWRKIGERRQSLTNRGNQHKNAKCIDYDYKVRDKVLVINKRYPPQSRARIWQRAMDYHYSSYEWNYQDSTWNQNGTT